MCQIKEALRLRFVCERSQSEIACTIGASKATVWEYLDRARRTQLSAAPCSANVRVRDRNPRDACAREPAGIGASRISVGPSLPPLGITPQVKQAMRIKVRNARSLPAGSYMPKTVWLLYAGNDVAPLRRKRPGSFMPEAHWLLCAGR
ncbi:sigma factor-like helix-turn-helix DNA-binding protein [Paraburkholderia sp. SARCC-3016]|uniref:sigma factor-like helix-turn-helix DNA-binding protein n=1 Tax=Paraburkholderia sp. SARCC-3016 TaxID=3058611 RepID=UPI0035BE23E4